MTVELSIHHMTDNQVIDLLVFYIMRNDKYKFNDLYKEFYSTSTDTERIRIFYFVRRALNLPNEEDNRY